MNTHKCHDKIIWKNYFFTADFTDCAEFLSDKEVGFVFEGEEADVLATFFQEHDPRLKNKGCWCSHDPEKDFSVVGGKVTYNGKNDSLMPTNSKYTHVMALDFSETPCKEPCGKVYLHYNLETE